MHAKKLNAIAISLLLAGLSACGGGGGGSGSPAPTPAPTPAPAPVMIVNPETISVGTVQFNNQSVVSKFTVSNSGNASLTLGDIVASGAYPGDFFIGGSCAKGGTVLPAANCEVSFTIKPTGNNVGTQSADISVASNGGNKTVRVNYDVSTPPPSPTPDPTPTPEPTPTPVPTPTPTPPPTPMGILSVAPTALDLGKVAQGAQSGDNIVTVTNAGNAALTLSDINISKTDAGDTGTVAADFFRGGSCKTGTPIAAQATCDVVFFVKPSVESLNGKSSVDLNLASDGGNKTVPVIYNSTAGSAILIAATATSNSGISSLTLGNGDFATPLSGSLYIRNIGSKEMTVNRISVRGTGEFTQTSNCFAAKVPAGGNCKVDLSAFPASEGEKANTLVIDTDAFNGNPRQVALSANITGTAPSLTVVPNANLTITALNSGKTALPGGLDFDTAPNFGTTVGQTSGRYYLRVLNGGSAAIPLFAVRVAATNGNWLSLGSSDASSSPEPLCGASLAAGAQCVVGVEFRPAAALQASGVVQLFTDANTLVSVTPVKGTGK